MTGSVTGLVVPLGVSAASFGIAAAVMLRRRVENTAGWLMLATGVVMALLGWPNLLVDLGGIGLWLLAFPSLLVPLLLLLFPTGRPLSDGWRWFAVAVGVGGAITLVVVLGAAAMGVQTGTLEDYGRLFALLLVGYLVYPAGALLTALAAWSLFLRARSWSAEGRRGLVGPAVAGLAMAFGFLVSALQLILAWTGWAQLVWAATMLLFSVVAAIAVVKHRVDDPSPSVAVSNRPGNDGGA